MEFILLHAETNSCPIYAALIELTLCQVIPSFRLAHPRYRYGECDLTSLDHVCEYDLLAGGDLNHMSGKHCIYIRFEE